MWILLDSPPTHIHVLLEKVQQFMNEKNCAGSFKLKKNAGTLRALEHSKKKHYLLVEAGVLPARLVFQPKLQPARDRPSCCVGPTATTTELKAE